jgi:hypothetical protein
MKKAITYFGHLFLFSIIQYLPNIFTDKIDYTKLILYGFPNNFYLVKSYISEDMCGTEETNFRIENLIINILIYFVIIYLIKFIISKVVLNNKQQHNE